MLISYRILRTNGVQCDEVAGGDCIGGQHRKYFTLSVNFFFPDGTIWRGKVGWGGAKQCVPKSRRPPIETERTKRAPNYIIRLGF